MTEETTDLIDKAFRALAAEVLREHSCETTGDFLDYLVEILEKHGVVVDCEVQHVLPGVDPVGCPNGWTIIDGVYNMPDCDGPVGEFQYEREGIHGREGKAVAIILSLENP